jgi:mRNA interferase RelE/StbE
MSSFRISVARPARKELEALNAAVLERVFPRIEALARNPRPPGARKLRGHRNLWRIRVGDYRVIYSIDDARRIVDVNSVRHLSDAYR